MKIVRSFSALVFLLGALAVGRRAEGQLGNLVSPGPLAKAHASIEGLRACEKCHEPGKKVSAAKCLACHEPIAARIKARRGLHRNVTEDCVSCHVDHAGRDGELRPFDTRSFDHGKETGFPLDGKHAPLAAKCDACHKTRSFVKLAVACGSCHVDPHKGALGPTCVTCHKTSVAFKDAKVAFDHTKTAFPLTVAHQKVACEKCHVEKKFRGLAFGSCSDCHKDPHRGALSRDCASCHSGDSFKTTKIDHAKTAFPLRGRHASVACVACHDRPALQVKPKASLCADCHQDPHKGTFKQDCASCHTENGFAKGTFDHAAKTRFPLADRHAAIACAACHKGGNGRPGANTGSDKTNGKNGARALDFKGLATSCVSCHQDVHKGQLGTNCETCHTSKAWKLPSFRHPRLPELFAGEHATVSCETCHKPVRAGGPETRSFRGLATSCVSCHKDVHQGQLGTSCESCHAVASPRFAASGLRHDAAFPLTGKHAAVPCASCHKRESAAGPVRYRGVSKDCASCHSDPHVGQLGATCASCHGTKTFKLDSYQHRKGKATDGLFTGRHATVPCASCHKKVEGVFPAGKGVAVKYVGIGAACGSCHKDPHRGSLGETCATCHRPDTAWRSASRAFHKQGAFPLEGRHLAVACESCHLKGLVKGTPTRCYDCHWIRSQDDKYRTRLGNECETCHRPTSWRALSWNHGSATGFTLSSPHARVACESCHPGGLFEKGRNTGCISCHLGEYQRTANPNHAAGGFPLNCEVCHKVSDGTFKHGRFDHAGIFPLQGAHVTQDCASCHKNGVYKGTTRTCEGCHKVSYDRSTSPSHLLAGFPKSCETCHRFGDASWKQGRFDHGKWPLVGVHTSQTCASCHRGGVFVGTSQICQSCHLDAYQKSTAPNHAQAAFPVTCEVCHRISDTTWKQGRFDHSSAFPLLGVHATQACASCHKNGVYKGTLRSCDGCHKTDYDKSTNPNHLIAGFPTTCDTCHKFTDPTWKQGTFVHTKWPLVGAHTSQTCASCHRGGVFAGTSQICQSCHLEAYQKTTAPNHSQAAFPVTCEVCHRVSDTSWKQGRFDHSSAFALQGVHATQACASCHRNGVYKGTPRTCVGCHLTEYEKSSNPNHLIAGFPTTCDTCHKFTDPTWKQGSFIHTKWPLVGAHTSQPCASCHRGGVFAGTSQICQSCHLEAYQKTTAPNHSQAAFPVTCEVCHRVSDTSWKQGRFDHSSAFALQGVHATQACASCHRNGVYKGTPRTCVGCHLTEYEKSSNPNHLIAGFPTSCDTCHKFTDPTWKQGQFDHARWPLVGAHASQTCGSCHRGGVFTGTSQICQSCHLDAYQKTTAPNHAQSGFPVTCEVCHRVSDTSWKQGRFDHNSAFPLQGVHATQACAACHGNGVYKGTPRTCAGCHLTEYQKTSNPSHLLAGFGTSCDTCHKFTDPTWKQGTYIHTRWPLVGLHATQTCATCHRGGVFTGTSSVCSSCHLPAYQATKNPNHTAAGFPTTCDTCHRAADTTWQQGKFTHTAFPIATGRHSGNPCSACHQNPSNFQSFTCLTCHDRTKMDKEHSGRAGYRYESAACYSCHPQGRS